MNKEIYLRSKQQALMDNIVAHEKELVTSKETLFVNPAVSFIDKQEKYEQKDFSSVERIVEILNRQSTIRGTQHIFHRLYTMNK